MNGIAIYNGSLFLSYSFLKLNKVPNKRLELWSSRGTSIKKYIDGQLYILYDSIPEPTRKQLPAKNELIAELNLANHDAKVESYYNNLFFCTTQGYIKHIPTFKEKYSTLSTEKINEICKLYAAWKYIVDLTINERNRDTSMLYVAFNKIYPNKYKNYNCFANAKKKAVDNGAEFVAVDSRLFTTPLNVKTVNVLNQYWVNGIVSANRKLSNKEVWKKICEVCELANEKAPSLSWVDKYRKQVLRSNINTSASSNGNAYAFAKQQPYASMQHALHANSQWQMDGWTLPFWVDNGTKFCRYVIVIVRDAYSKKIVGSAVGETENTLLIMAALKDAIINTGCLPYEILTDNHSFNQTKEAAYFKDAIGKIGTVFTVTSNPQHKSIIERYNRHLYSFCKEYYGCIGEGVKSKSKNAHAKQESIDAYAKNQISVGEIQLIGIDIVEKSNASILEKEGKTPNQLFDESEKPNCFAVDVFERIKILTAQTEIKIVRGQLNITRSKIKYEYQLPANLYQQYNDTTVIVRYEDLNECIYLYDKATDEPIIELNQKLKIHGALADQNEIDIELLNKNKGRIAGIKSQAAKSNESLTEKALQVNSDAYLHLNKVTTPKNVLNEMEQNANLKRIAIDKGININLIHVPLRESEMDNNTLKPKQKINDSPFTDKNHVIRKISLKDLEQE